MKQGSEHYQPVPFQQGVRDEPRGNRSMSTSIVTAVSLSLRHSLSIRTGQNLPILHKPAGRKMRKRNSYSSSADRGLSVSASQALNKDVVSGHLFGMADCHS